jgi:hypothetical protein
MQSLYPRSFRGGQRWRGDGKREVRVWRGQRQAVLRARRFDEPAMELVVKIKMGEDLAVFPQDRDLPAVSFVVAVIADKFPCSKAK